MTLGVTAPSSPPQEPGSSSPPQLKPAKPDSAYFSGSAEKGTEVLEKLRKLGAETPLQLGVLTKATQTLAAFQATGDDLIGTLRMIGDLAMGDAARMQSISLAYGQISVLGKKRICRTSISLSCSSAKYLWHFKNNLDFRCRREVRKSNRTGPG
jgi:hypothetical protein